MRVVLLIVAAAAGLVVQAPDLGTRAETSNYEETSSYDDVTRVVNGIAASNRLARQESFGRTEEDRLLPLLILSEPAVTTPEATRRLGRPIVFIQANISRRRS